jgi:hypothetical protein
MRKIDSIIDALLVEFKFHHDISHIKTWWKVGGSCPFDNETAAGLPSMHELQQKISEAKEKLPFIIMSIVTEETGDQFKTLSGSDLIHISDKAASFADDFLNPFHIDCPSEYIRLVVRHELMDVLNNRQR